LEAVRGLGVLTVGETPDFIAAGGIVGFATEQGKLYFDVNLDAAKEARLKISSILLSLARHVLNPTEAAKS
jgi:hypothetical protein